MKHFFLNGGLRAKSDGSIVLTMYSTPFARLLTDKKIKKIDVGFSTEGFTVRLGNKCTLNIERKKENRPLCVVHVTKFIPKPLIENLRSDKQQRRVKVKIEDIATQKDLVKYNQNIVYIEPKNVNCNIPKSELIKVGCHISCFRNKSGFNYRFNIRHRILEEIAVKKEKVVVIRNPKGKFIIRKHHNGRKFNFHKNKKGHPLAYMQISPSLITEKENKLFESGRRCFSSRAYLSGREFDLNISNFFMTKDERELAYALLKKNINVRIPEMRKREADIVLKDFGIQIEITHLKPREKENHKNSPHTEGVHINARICEGFLRVIKGITPYYFVIFDKQWLNYSWVKDLIEMVKPKVFCLTTDFNDDWEEIVSSKIKSILIKLNLIE
jgi:hypothetical protein